MAVGRVTKVGDTFATVFNILEVETKDSLFSGMSRGDENSLFFGQVDDLVSQMTEKIEWSAPLTEASPPTTSNVAYEHYLNGITAYRNFYFEEARQHFLAAVETDPEFATAYLRLGRTYLHLRRAEDMIDALEKALTLIDRANPKDSLYIQAFHARYIERDIDKSIQILEEIVDKYQSDKEGFYILGTSYRNKELWDDAVNNLQIAINLDPRYGEALNRMAEIFHRQLIDMEKAAEYAKRYVEAVPNTPNPLDTLGVIYRDMGEFDLSIKYFKQALEIKPNFEMSLRNIGYAYALNEDYNNSIKYSEQFIEKQTEPAIRFYGYILKAFYLFWTGAYERVLDELSRARSFYEENQNQFQGDTDLQALMLYHDVRSWVFLERGDYENFRTEQNRLFNLYSLMLPKEKSYVPTLEEELMFVNADCLRGDLEAAKIRLNKAEKLSSEYKDTNRSRNFGLKALQAKIMIAEGSWEDAIDILKQLPSPKDSRGVNTAIQICYLNHIPYIKLETELARAYDLKGELDKAIAVLEDFIRFNPADKDLRLNPPKVYYNLGRLYEKKGNRAAASKNYRRFLEIWKKADPELPEFQDARMRLAGLKGN